MTESESNLDQMQRELKAYFAAEKAESLVFLIAGVAALVIGVWLWPSPGYARGVAWPLMVIGVIQWAVGSTVFFRANRQMSALTRVLGEDAHRFATEETGRMSKLMRAFRIYRVVEIALLAVGVAIVFLAVKESFWYGVGTGLVIQSALMLALDVLAERRGEEYLEAIQELLT